MRVLAGPGSGKTAVITERIKNLIYSYGIPPDKILVITFTKEAAKEMQRRFYQLMQKEYAPVQFGTFHAVFFKILKETYHYSSENILTEMEKQKFLSSIIRKNRIQTDTHPDHLKHILEEIKLMRKPDFIPETYEPFSMEKKEFLILTREYLMWKKKENRLDFDDMDQLCSELFSKRKQVLKRWQEEYEYILIDEFQDISMTQYQVVQRMAEPENNLFIVGDDDQSIYSFRGADPEIMIGFQKDYPYAEQVLLGVNYRSSREIVKASALVIGENKNRLPKKISTFQEEGEKARIRAFPDKTQQYRVLAQELKDIQEQDKDSSAAVIVRTNGMFPEMIRMFSEYQVSYQSREKGKCIYEEEFFYDVTAYLKLAGGDENRENFLRIMNRPLRYLRREEIGENVSLKELLEQNRDRKTVLEAVGKLIKDITMISRMPLYLAVNYIRKGMGYDEFWLEKYGRGEKWEEYLDKADFLQESSRDCMTLEKWMEKAETEIKNWKTETTGKDADIGKDADTGKHAISLLTMHASKGLEFDHVFMPDCNEGISPHHKAKEEKEVEEERRMFYVGMTRAKKHLELLYVTGSNEKPVYPSRFLALLN